IDLLSQWFSAHSGGVGELGVVMVTEQVVEAAGGRGERVNVGVRVEEGNAADFVEENAGERVVEHDDRPASGIALLVRASGLSYNRPVGFTNPEPFGAMANDEIP